MQVNQKLQIQNRHKKKLNLKIKNAIMKKNKRN